MKKTYLSKSRFMAGMQCPKRLYLTVYPPEMPEEEDSGESLPILNGNTVGEMACKLYPGVMVEYDQGLSAAIAETSRLVADEQVQCIHEATFSYDNILVRVDLLERTDSGWILTEVKAATSVKEYYLNDATVQAWVVQGCGLKLDVVRLMHVNNQFVYQGDDVYDGLLHAADISDIVLSRIETIGEQKDIFMEMLAGDIPDIEMGEQCYSPYECDFCTFCQPEELPEYPLNVLPRMHAPKREALQAEGYEDVRDIPDGILQNPNHQRVWRATCAGKEEVDAAEVAVLKAWGWPRYYLDFETIGLAVPRWKGVRPYAQVPFQWSCHIHHEDGRMEHVEFLDVSGSDPRRSCAEGLVEHIGAKGILIAYNAGFERRVIRELAEIHPDLSEALLDMNERFVDLLPVTRNAYYHPSQMGSWSIKAVLPALVPELDYADLDGVQNGGDAQLAWMQAANAESVERKHIADQLLKYCKLDTLAMVKIVDALLRRISHA
ncbi:DUF2779 domain-containing protein [Mariprofundus ferrooxydans]|nr:DUF2779 domain-containing protein [Mariprofundus ferrooxydans]MBN4077050.1 DUF2779 domain-containing protein [Mariprofundus ferrooxydans]